MTSRQLPTYFRVVPGVYENTHNPLFHSDDRFQFEVAAGIATHDVRGLHDGRGATSDVFSLLGVRQGLAGALDEHGRILGAYAPYHPPDEPGRGSHAYLARHLEEIVASCLQLGMFEDADDQIGLIDDLGRMRLADHMPDGYVQLRLNEPKHWASTPFIKI